MNIAETAAIVNALNNSGGGGGSSDPYAAYDLIIKINSFDLTSASDLEVIKGDFEQMETKALDFKPITALIFGYDPDDPDRPYTKTITTASCYFNNYSYNLEEHSVDIYALDIPFTVDQLNVRGLSFFRDGSTALNPTTYFVMLQS